MRTWIMVAIAAGLLAGAPLHARALTLPAEDGLTPAESRRIAKEAYVYGFPLVDNYRVLHSYFVDVGGPEFKTPWNTLYNNARVYTPADKAIQTPNSDTPYSQLGADLRSEPLVLTVPGVEKGRYYSLQFIDLYTHNFAYVGSRATGGDAGSYLLAGPDWKGEKPDGIKGVIRCETQFAFVLYRTQLFNPGDIENVKKVQAGYKVEPLSAFLGKPAPAAAPPIEFLKPLTPEQQRTAPEFFKVLDFVLRFCPTHPSERELRARLAKLGLGAGRFDAATLPDETRSAIAKGMSDAWKEFAEFKRTQIDTGKRTAADGFGTREYLKNDYLSRMSSAVLGIYGNSKEEALYPIYFTDSQGGKLDGSRNRYTLRFPPGGLPPVNAFWSLTMYELPSSLLVDNPLDRYLINSAMLPHLKRDADGGLTLYLQHESPSDGKDANWLPAPDGEFFAVLRLYWPKKEALTGAWKAPPLERTSDDAAKDSAAEIIPVTVENFARAESDVSFDATVKGFDAFGKFHHNREPTRLDKQAVIRMNRDTLYSAAVFDLDAGPVTVALPDAGGRFISMQVINQDHYTPLVAYGGTHTLMREAVGTRYVMVIVRTLADAADPADLAAAARIQDAIRVEQPGGPGRFEIPRWDPASRKKVRDALNVLADTLPDKNRMFGTKAEVDPVRYLLGVASAWGGNPDKEAVYLNAFPKQNDGKTVYRMTVKDVPVDGFWSVCVYNAQGYFEPNPANAYVVNSVTAKKGADGSVTIQFGGDPKDAAAAPNVLPITPGWNFMVRLYRPRKEILDGTWKFPEAVPADTPTP